LFCVVCLVNVTRHRKTTVYMYIKLHVFIKVVCYTDMFGFIRTD